MLDNVNTPILCEKTPRMGNKFSQSLGTAVLNVMGWRYSGTFPCCSKMILAVVNDMADRIREAESIILCLAPEGTRSQISAWKTGFLHIAHKANVPVFLVTFDYKKKLIEFGPMHNISDNTQHELNRIYLHFKQAQGKYPEKMLIKMVPPVEREIEK